MNKHMRLVASLLFIVVILLAIAITKFYSDTSKNTSRNSAQTDIERRLGSDSAGNRIFEDSAGNYGVLDSSDRVIVPAEWLELSFAGEGRCIAAKRISGKVLRGCVDYEGNIDVPFIYRSITPFRSGEQTLYIAESGIDSSFVVYDKDFSPFFRNVWSECSISGNEMLLKCDDGTYLYETRSDGLRMKEAELTCKALGCENRLTVKSQLILDKLDPELLRYIVSAAGKYLGFAYTGDGSYISEVRTGGRPAFTKLFPEDKRIIDKKLLGIEEIFMYSSGSDNGIPVLSVGILAKTEIKYKTDGSDKPEVLTDSYRCTVKFSGTTGSDITALSGSFELAEPKYPEPEQQSARQPDAPGETEAQFEPPVNNGQGDDDYE
ncbi:MAG: hypothetical protein IKO47_08025 [Ruminococcus sp.]|nr:hypothetical protein [Ruminococcus sp.]